MFIDIKFQIVYTCPGPTPLSQEGDLLRQIRI